MEATQSFDEATHTYVADGQIFPHVTGILSEAGFYKGSDWWTPEGRIFGGYAHQAIEYFNRGTLDWDELDAALVGCVRSYQHFCEATGFEPILVEKILFADLGFAGKPDIFGVFPDQKTAVIDVKTGAPQPADQIQTCMYQMLLEQNDHKVTMRGSLYVDRNGGMPAWRVHKERSDFAVAMSLLTIHNFKLKARLL